jgi:hypothetical protein
MGQNMINISSITNNAHSRMPLIGRILTQELKTTHMKTEKVYTQHEENKEWMNSLMFYTDEIKIMQGRLAEVASKNTSKEVMAQVEHFQNKLIIDREAIDVIKQEINLSNDVITNEVRKNETAIDHRKIKDHSLIRENMSSFEGSFSSLRKEFKEFVAKWL